jgi:glyoxylase-like metal-dependent hydrolase (beta-lactamase superfamily II)
MPFVSIFPNVYTLGLGPVNLFLIQDEGGLTLIDTGYENSETTIVAALQQLGHPPTDVKNIIVTHCHPDHAGSLAAMKQLTQAPAWMHPADAEIVGGGTSPARPQVSPGLLNRFLYQIFIKNSSGRVPAATVEKALQDDQVLPFAGGLRAIHAPGHSTGQMALLYPQGGGLLFVADACGHIAGLDYSLVYNDVDEGRRSLRKLAQLNFTAVCFSHGKLLKDAAKFKAKWA